MKKIVIKVERPKFRIPISTRSGFSFKCIKGKGSYNRKKEKQVKW